MTQFVVITGSPGLPAVRKRVAPPVGGGQGGRGRGPRAEQHFLIRIRSSAASATSTEQVGICDHSSSG